MRVHVDPASGLSLPRGKLLEITGHFDDPAAAAGTDEARMAVFRRVRDEIAAQIDAFLAGRSGARP